jgi:RNA polymerase sigma-70 factor (ECF subfamily)
MNTGKNKKSDAMKLFNELLTYKESVFRICLGFSKDPWDAEELTQEVYLKAYKKIGTLKDPQFAKPWLFKITKNLCLDHRKKNIFSNIFKSKSNSELIERKTPESIFFCKEELKNLKKVVRNLPKKLKEVFILREYGHLPYREIALILKIKIGTVMSRLHRARQIIVKKLREGNYEK